MAVKKRGTKKIVKKGKKIVHYSHKPVEFYNSKRKTKPWIISGFIVAMIAVVLEVILLVLGTVDSSSALYRILSPVTYPGAALMNGFTNSCMHGESETGPVIICPESYQLFSMAATLVIIILIYFCIGAVIGLIYENQKKFPEKSPAPS